MTEKRVVKNPFEDVVRGWPEYGLFRPMIPFGDVFGVNPFALMR